MIKHLSDLKAFIEYSTYMGDVYNIINNYKPRTKIKNLIWLSLMTWLLDAGK